MAPLKITYWVPGARIGAAIVALETAGIEYEFESVGEMGDWIKKSEDRKQFPLADIPTLNINGRVMCETAAINTYVALKTGFWPSDPLHAATGMEVFSTQEQIFTGLGEWPCLMATMMLPDDQKKAARQGGFSKRLEFYANHLNDLAKLSTTGYITGSDKPSLADFGVTVLSGFVRSGTMDHVDPTILDKYEALQAVADKIKKDPRFAKGLQTVGVLEVKK